MNKALAQHKPESLLVVTVVSLLVYECLGSYEWGRLVLKKAILECGFHSEKNEFGKMPTEYTACFILQLGSLIFLLA